MSTRTLIAKYEALPSDAQKQVQLLVEALTAATESAPKKKRFTFDWAGGLEDMKDEFTTSPIYFKRFSKSVRNFIISVSR